MYVDNGPLNNQNGPHIFLDATQTLHYVCEVQILSSYLQSKNKSPVIHDGIIFFSIYFSLLFFLPKISSSNAQ